MTLPGDRIRCLALQTTSFAVALSWLILRAPNLLSSPRFWGEEGAFFSAATRLEWWESLVFIYWRQGYFMWPANLGATLGAHTLPLEYAPLATTCIAFLLQLSPFIALHFLRFDFDLSPAQRGLIGFSLLAATTTGQGVAWLNSINSQTHVGILAAIILLASADQNRTSINRLSIAALALCGLSGLYAVFMLPVFLAVAVVERNRWRSFQTAAIGCATMIQGALLLYKRFGLEQVHEKRAGMGIDLTAIRLGLRETFALPLFGQQSVLGTPDERHLLLMAGFAIVVISLVTLVRSSISRSKAEAGQAPRFHQGSARMRWLLERAGAALSPELRPFWLLLVVYAAVSLGSFAGGPTGRYTIVPGAMVLLIVHLACVSSRSFLLRLFLLTVIAASIGSGIYWPRNQDLLACDGVTSGWSEGAQHGRGPEQPKAILKSCPAGWTVKVYPEH